MGKNVYHITEKDMYLPPSSMSLITIADTIGTRLMNMYNEMENIKVSYPESGSEVDSFINLSIIPLNDKIKNLIQTEIPKLETITTSRYKGDTSAYKDLGYSVRSIKDKSTLDILLKLKKLEKEATDLEKKAEGIKTSINSEYQGSQSTKALEDSVLAIINKVRDGIVKQAELNIRYKKRGDIIAGTTDVNDASASRAAGVPKSNASSIRKRKTIDDISAYLAKKYGY